MTRFVAATLTALVTSSVVGCAPTPLLFLSGMAATTCVVACRTHETPLRIVYETNTPDATGVTRMFHTKRTTVLQFVDVHKAQPTVYADQNPTPLPYTTVGQQMAVFQGIYPHMRIEAHNTSLRIPKDQTHP